ncbi:PAS domain-containing sensor histidine kinase [Marinicauda pacifica]|uniref:histidine kinase n=1 Tax=Marinicauda pacifica TaxID=1133559 RepID=A0A4S2HG22_9PROT|nr:PAS domain-containing sensor histidine kinase [Marinicauda pacifica]TGY94768.1 PAS domain-containing sensor histidine kinase [Marinicauda pacifica]
MLDEHHIGSRSWQVNPDPMCILDTQGRFVAVNPAWEATLGWTREEMVGEAYRRFLHPDDIERSDSAFEDVTQGKPVLRFENRYRAKFGGYRWLSWVAVPEADGIYCTSRDVTPEKERDQTIAKQREEAELREQFLAILGHDLRTPLSSFISGLRLLSREVESENAQQVLQSMQGSASRMSELIRNMMEFARVRLGDGIGIERERHQDLDSRIFQVVEEIENTVPGARIEYTADLSSSVMCDASRIMQVVSNLLGNAVSHGVEGEPVRLTATQADGQLTIAVANAGEPISSAARENLFRPFFKGDPQSSPQGLGLGLYISSEIAAAHGGSLTVDSDTDQTCFTLTIPATE